MGTIELTVFLIFALFITWLFNERDKNGRV